MTDSIGFDNELSLREQEKAILDRMARFGNKLYLGFVEKETVERSELLMKELGVKAEDRAVVGPARQAAVKARETGKGNKGIFVGAALELRDGSIVLGENSPLMHAASGLVLNAIKKLAGIPGTIHFLSPGIVESVANLKEKILGSRTVSLDLSEVLLCLSINAASNPMARLALDRLKDLQGCEVHMTHIPTPGDEAGLRRFGINLTSDPNFSTKSLFVS